MNTDDMRPRRRSGVTSWLMAERQTALTLSAAPATASSAAAAHSDPASPASAIAAPQTATAQITIRPSRRAWASQPVVSAATVAPAETAAYSRPVPSAPASYTLTASTANRARGMPNVIATRSIANEPRSAWLRRTNRRPSAIERRTGGRSAPSPRPVGGCGDIAAAAATIARQLTACDRVRGARPRTGRSGGRRAPGR